ncbi:MAG TPA: IS110 family transposase [Solirubrobacteraceae bacterium]|jgi:transposase
METVHQRCAGIDIGKRSLTVCVITTGTRGEPAKETRTFRTLTRDLLALADWLDERGVTAVAMEATGSYWKPIWNLLEDRFELLLANAAHLKAVPGRKTDVRDAEWIAELFRHGLLRASFIPPRPERELRELVRYRTSLIRERASEINRLAKVLEGANIKLGSVSTNIGGVSGRAILAALTQGASDPEALAQLAKGRLRNKHEVLVEALAGSVGPHQRFLLAAQLRHLGDLDTLIESLDAEIKERLRGAQELIERLSTIPGVGRRSAEVILSEIGADMTRFGSARQLASWAGMCPGNYESAGVQHGGQTRKGSPWLRTALVNSARSASRTKTYLGAQYHRLAARRGAKRAFMAVGHTILGIVYELLTTGQSFRDLGTTYFDQRDAERIRRRLTHRLEALGYTVTLAPHAA